MVHSLWRDPRVLSRLGWRNDVYKFACAFCERPSLAPDHLVMMSDLVFVVDAVIEERVVENRKLALVLDIALESPAPSPLVERVRALAGNFPAAFPPPSFHPPLGETATEAAAAPGVAAGTAVSVTAGTATEAAAPGVAAGTAVSVTAGTATEAAAPGIDQRQQTDTQDDLKHEFLRAILATIESQSTTWTHETDTMVLLNKLIEVRNHLREVLEGFSNENPE